jgi:glyoxylate utilization-related uncharacterized protein
MIPSRCHAHLGHFCNFQLFTLAIAANIGSQNSFSFILTMHSNASSQKPEKDARYAQIEASQ